ncbi:hypothetical protein K469DRAFT_686913 [Zopfia rhizophila CBS 207.26]|uniref:CHAT domain-containing protein n=1 Tax=Zopfia rhizophila CBS 207.26 TaxID=1314779 RepID=A0A6A6E7Q3_9PEZI|nr:hypothetical protein K469DRAFT_686913 [Zopfia rhizophila CBS 207.26]
MNIEIIRPGTLASPEQYFQHTERSKGPNCYSIVHFDLHSKVGPRRRGSEIKNAVVYFAHSRADGTKAESTLKLARILLRHGVPLVVLNACESARANYGDDANIAKVLEKEGIKGVLAMSFKVSSTAASTFLSVLYDKFLMRGSSFLTAAARARSILRSAATRHARFSLELPLHDWFVLIVYSFQEDIFVSRKQSNTLDSIPSRADAYYDSQDLMSFKDICWMRF